MAPRSRGATEHRSWRSAATVMVWPSIAVVLLSTLLAAATAAKTTAATATTPTTPPQPPGSDERFTEELLLRPLPSGHLLALFHFESSAPAHRAHHARFPRAAAQLLAAAPAARRVELSLATGRWRPGSWGAAPFEAKPGGAELRAAFDVGAAVEQYLDDDEDGREEAPAPAPAAPAALRRAWDSLAHGLSGLLCASLNFVARPEATVREVDLLGELFPEQEREEEKGDDRRRRQQHPPVWMRASLPREAVCTENLTPWLKLLPCRDGQGLAALLRARPAVFAAEYHALSVSLRREDGAEEGEDGGGGGGSDSGRLVLAQRFALVLRPLAEPQGGAPAARIPPSPGRWAPWSLAATLAADGALSGGACPQAALSRVYVSLPPEEAGKEEDEGGGATRMVLFPPPQGTLPANFRAAAAAVGVDDSGGGAPSAAAQRRRLRRRGAPVYWYDTDALAGSGAGDVSLSWQPEQAPLAPAPLKPRWEARAYTTGASMARGALVLELEMTAGGGAGATTTPPPSFSPSTPTEDHVVCASLVVPWFVRAWVHTLELSLDGARADLDAHTVARRVVPASARAAPLALDLCLAVPRSARLCRLSASFSTGFMTVFEFPPDAHRGVDVPAARVTWLEDDEEEEDQEDEGGEEGGAAAALLAATLAASPLLAELSRPREAAAYSDGVLVALAPPDFSMPYNVVCLTSTALAVYVGASVNGLLRRGKGQGRKGRRRGGGDGRGSSGRQGGRGGGGGKGDGGEDEGCEDESGSESGSSSSDDQEGDRDEAARLARAARRRARKRRRVLRALAFGGVFVGLALWIDPELRASCAAYLPEEWRPRNATEEARGLLAGVA